MRFRDYAALAFRSLRRSRLRSGLTISALLVGATGVTIMLTFVTSVKNYIVDQFVQSGQVQQIAVAENTNLTYDPSGQGGGGPGPGPGGGTVSRMTPGLESKITALPHVTGVSAILSDDGPGSGIEYLGFGATRLQAQFFAYQANGVIQPPLLAGQDLRSTDSSGVMLVSQDYADALGFKSNYAGLIGQTIDLHTRQGYTGVGASLPHVLPPPQQCSPGEHRVDCGPTGSLPAIVLHARVLGVVSRDFQGGETTYVPLSWMVGFANDAQPQGLQYASPPRNNQCRPGQPCQANPFNPQCQPGAPCGQQGPGIVTGGWTRESNDRFITDRGGYRSMLVKVDAVDDVATVAKSIDGLGVNAATGLAALDQQKNKANTLGAILGSLGLVALGIAALGVMNTMIMSVLERTREIGVMRALGARRSTIRRLFAFEAASLGFFGGVFGVVIGYVFVIVAKPIISRAVKSGKLAGASFAVPIWLVIAVIAGTTLIGLLSGLIPARRAAKLDPVEALRYE